VKHLRSDPDAHHQSPQGGLKFVSASTTTRDFRLVQTDERSSIVRGPTLMPLHANRCSTRLSIMRVLKAALDRDAYSTMVRAVAAATARG
jgi:hypothetical protein